MIVREIVLQPALEQVLYLAESSEILGLKNRKDPLGNDEIIMFVLESSATESERPVKLLATRTNYSFTPFEGMVYLDTLILQDEGSTYSETVHFFVELS